MAALTSSNFQFLSVHDTLLVALGAQAERYFELLRHGNLLTRQNNLEECYGADEYA